MISLAVLVHSRSKGRRKTGEPGAAAIRRIINYEYLMTVPVKFFPTAKSSNSILKE